MENAEAIHVQPNSRTTTGPAPESEFSGCIMPDMASSGQGSERLNAQLLVDSIPALIHTARPDGYLDYFNKPWLEYLGVTLDKVAGWNWTAFVHPEDAEGILAKWRACLATGEIFEHETRIRRANGEYRWMFHRKVPLRNANGDIVKWYGSSLDIDERKTAEEQLRRNAKELQRSEFYLAEGQRLAHMGSWAFDPDGFYYWSPELFRMYGLDPASKPPSIQEYLDCIHPQDRESMADLIQGIFAEASPFDATKRIVRPNGEVRYIRCVGAPVVENQILKKYVGSAIDVTEHAFLTEDLRRREAYLTEAQRLSHTGSWAWNLRTSALFWSEEIFRIYGYNPQEIGPTWAQFLERIHPEDRPQIEQRATTEATRKEWVDSHGDFRIVLPDGTIKYLHSVAHPAKDITGEITEIIGTVMDVTESELLTQELRRREAYLAEAQKLSHTGSFGWKPDTGEIVWSDETYRIFEYGRSVNPTMDSLVQRVHPEDRADFKEVVYRAFAGATDFEHSYRLLLPDGRVKYVHAIAHVLQHASGSREFVGAVSDVSEQRHAEAVIRAQEAELRQVVDTIPAIVWSTLPDGSNTYVNKRFVEYSGSSAEQMAGSGWQALIHPDDLERHAGRWIEAVATGKPLENEVRSRRSDGQYRWQLDRGVPLRDKDGNIIKWYGVTTDIEDRKRAEEALGVLSRDLQENKAKLEEAQRVAHVGYWEWDLRTDHVTWSDETYRIYGLDPQEGPIELATIRESIHPEDREFVFRKAAGVVQGEVRVDAEHRIVRPNGEVRVVHSQGDLKRDAAGLPWQMFGTVQDITDRKLAEDKVREQESELRQIVDLVPQLVAVFGPAGERLYANRIVLDYVGLSLEEWRQTPGNFFSSGAFHPDDRERAARTHSDNARSGGSAYELELRIRKREGAHRWFLVRFNPLRDEHGQITRWYIALTDIEDRKQAEDKLRQENVALREEIDKASMFEEIVGTSPALKNVLSRISKVAPTDSTVLITGETGTGKELVARAIHRRSNRASRPFVSVNCAAIPRDLIASELFGHEKGAFTGATQLRLGRFELASGGTIFLDEVGELPAETQVALLRVLQEHEFERVGGTRRIRADVRVIAATNRDLQAAIAGGSFRSDLFYRLNVFPIEIPSLRERRADIPLLVEYFIDRYARKAGKKIKRVNKKTLELLQSYPWPGNIRELQNVIERSVILCESEIFSIEENWLPPLPLTPESKRQVELPVRLLVQEKDMIEAALKDTRGRVSGPRGAAVKLGIPRSTLESKIRSLKIDKNRFRTLPEM
jgi:formate hydrogenlyase transcriptional activator